MLFFFLKWPRDIVFPSLSVTIATNKKIYILATQPSKKKVLFFFMPNYFFYVYLFILRNFCHRPGENRMFLKILLSKTNFTFFLFSCIGHHSDVTWNFFVFILVDMDRGNQARPIHRYQIQHHRTLIIENLWGLQRSPLRKICLQKTAWLDKG